MENENKGKKVLEIILLILVALSFVLIPLLNQYKQKTLSLNHTQLVKRQNDRNGTIFSTTFDYKDVLTIHSGFADIIDRNFYLSQQDINSKNPIFTSDFLGLGFTNYFRFSLTDFVIPNTHKIYALQYYLLLDDIHSLSFNLGYYDIYQDSDNIGNFMMYSIITRSDFDSVNLSPEYNILNFSYYNPSNYDTFYDNLDLNGFIELLYFGSDFQEGPRFDTYTYWSNTNIVIFEEDFITSLLNATGSSKFQEGFEKGYDKGVSDTNGSSVFGVLQRAASAISSFMNIEVLPNISMWLLVSIPLSISIMIIILRLLRGGS